LVVEPLQIGIVTPILDMNLVEYLEKFYQVIQEEDIQEIVKMVAIGI